MTKRPVFLSNDSQMQPPHASYVLRERLADIAPQLYTERLSEELMKYGTNYYQRWEWAEEALQEPSSDIIHCLLVFIMQERLEFV